MNYPRLCVSVIVPIYNVERYVGICIESILNQTYENLEILLIDDGSTDRCPEICDLYAKKDSRIRVIHKENGGLVSARKAGLAASHGEYISNIDGDDWVDSDFIASLLEAILISNSDAAIAGHKRCFFGKTEKLLNSLPFGVYEGDDLNKLFSTMISTGKFFNQGVYTYLWNKLFKREVLFQAQMNVDNRIFLGEDAACAYTALLNCNRIVVTGNSSYRYRQREDSMLKKRAPFCQEAPSIKLLYNHMIGALTSRPASTTLNLQEQIRDYILSIYIIRSGGLIPVKREPSTFPFGSDLRGKRVAIYSAGTFGQQLRMRLIEAEHCEIVGWYDDDYWEYRRCCLDVDPVEMVKSAQFDYLLLAMLNSERAAVIKSKLANMGVPPEKIKLVEYSDAAKKQALQDYLSYTE